MLCGVIIAVLLGVVLFDHRDHLKALIAKLRGQTPPSA